MSYINNPDITKEDILKKSLAHWNVGKTQEWIDRDMAIVMGKREGYYFWDMDGRKFLDIHINGGTYNLGHRNKEIIGALTDAMTELDIGNHHFTGITKALLAEQLTNLTKLEGAWVRGYEKVRKLSDEDKKFIPMFVLLRRITRLAWLATHSDSDTAKTVDDEYLDVTIDMAKEWLKANTRVAVITGAAGGIGYGIAKKFLESCK